jgi:DNA-binding HxlR family transcriptional regulator
MEKNSSRTHNVMESSCRSREVLDLIADKWTVMIIHALSCETKRFNELQRQVEGISQKVLTQSLRRMERDGLLLRTVYPVVPPKVEYSLTDLGKSLVDILKAVTEWSEGHIEKVDAAREKYDGKIKNKAGV